MIEIVRLTAAYGSSVALNDINFTFKNGEIYALLGPNGAGKSTLIKILLSVCKPFKGTVLYDGIDITKQSEKIKERIGFMLDKFLLINKLNAYEFLEFIGRAYKVNMDDSYYDRIDYILDALNLKSVAENTIDTYSLGMKKSYILPRR